VKSRLERALAVVGATAILVIGFDTITFAATGGSLILGRTNRANATTVLENTGATPPLSLLAQSTATAPFSTNAGGRVANLNADKLDGFDNLQLRALATKLNGLTAAQIVALAHVPLVTFARTAVNQQSVSLFTGTVPGFRSGIGASGTFRFTATVTFACGIHAAGALGYSVRLFRLSPGPFGGGGLDTTLSSTTVNLARCGTAIVLPNVTAVLAAADSLVVSVRSTGCASTCVESAVPQRFVKIDVKGFDLTRAL
jgi:hypothetical protein